MKSDFMLAISQLCAERKLSTEVVFEAVEAALISAYRRNFGSANNIEVQIEPKSGDVRVYAVRQVVEEVEDSKTEVTPEEARRVDPEAELGDTVLIESTPRDFGRIAAQTAKQVILQRIREAEREAQYETFADRAGEIVHGTIQSIDYHSRDARVSLDGAEALLSTREQVPGEHYRRGMRLRTYVLDVRRGNRGPQIALSRRSPELLRRLLELEVPEIFNGTVEIKGITREAGSRSKVAVYATQDGVDPVGSCVGVRGQRIQNIVSELNGEKIDIVQWDPDEATFIANALSPAKVMNVLLDNDPEAGKTATVIVPDRQLSLAIGKEGQNARLAAKLTGWRIDIKSATEATAETLGRLEEVEVPAEEMDLLALAETMLRKGRLGELDEEERAVIEAQMAQASAEDLPWPEKEPEAEAEMEPAAAEKEAEPLTPEPEDEVEEDEESAEVEVEAAAPATEAPEAGVEQEESDATEAWLEDEAEKELPLEGEPVETSLGWVPVQPEEDWYSGWGEADEEEEEEAPEAKDQWVREDPDELQQRRDKKGKKKKGRKWATPRYQDEWK
jgi:N utilization substance protein A